MFSYFRSFSRTFSQVIIRPPLVLFTFRLASASACFVGVSSGSLSTCPYHLSRLVRISVKNNTLRNRTVTWNIIAYYLKKPTFDIHHSALCGLPKNYSPDSAPLWLLVPPGERLRNNGLLVCTGHVFLLFLLSVSPMYELATLTPDLTCHCVTISCYPIYALCTTRWQLKDLTVIITFHLLQPLLVRGLY